MFGVFRVKNHDYTQKKSYFFQFYGGGRGAPDAPSPLDPPLLITPLVSSNCSSLSFLLEDKTQLSRNIP
jgi:hypothetical protein